LRRKWSRSNLLQLVVLGNWRKRSTGLREREVRDDAFAPDRFRLPSARPLCLLRSLLIWALGIVAVRCFF
jgi:hypothetical protein